MEKFELIAPCHFGMEAVLKREILDLGYEITKVEDGKVTFEADAQGIADANIFLRSTERILLKVAEVKAETFDELFEKTKALPWENYIPKDGKFLDHFVQRNQLRDSCESHFCGNYSVCHTCSISVLTWIFYQTADRIAYQTKHVHKNSRCSKSTFFR